jgi:hypothetical protein
MNVLPTCSITIYRIAAALYQHNGPRVDVMDLHSTRTCLPNVRIHVLEGENVFNSQHE